MGASKLSHGPPCLSHVLNLSLLTIQSVTVLIQQLLHISTLLGVKRGLPLSFILPSSTTSSAMTTLMMEASGAFQAFSLINAGCHRLVPSVWDSYLVGNCCYLLNTTSDGTFLSVVCKKVLLAKSWGAPKPPRNYPIGKVSLFHVWLRPSHHLVLCFCLFVDCHFPHQG